MNAPPASTSLDQECVEDFGRFLPVECLPRTVVEFVGDGADRGIDVGFEQVWGEPERRVLPAGIGMVREFVFPLFLVVL
jgi:hypothetical protein